MLTAAENELFTQTSRGTPMGELLRRYWHPIASLTDLDDRWTLRVRLLGEDLVLFKKRPDIRPGIGAAEAAPQTDRGGRLGLVGEACPHRRASLAYGIPTADGIRCPYHGWMFDGAGRCLEQPNEPEGSSFKDKVALPGYPVQVLAGMVWAYLGPLPAPLIPRLDGYVAEPAIRLIGRAIIPCSWLQVQENSLDPVHAEWLHGHFAEFVAEQQGARFAHSRKHVRIAFDEMPYGFVQRRLLEGQDETASDWTTGHPIIFPNAIGVGSAPRPGDPWHLYEFQVRVPVDDTHTNYLSFTAFVRVDGAELPRALTERAFTYDIPLDREDLNVTAYQDFVAWLSQGAITDRTQEHLGYADHGITMFRSMLRRELRKVEAGEDPILFNRDPAADRVFELPLETGKAHYADGFETMLRRRIWQYAGISDELLEVMAR
jgi:5,5'-dehydrodivanillate O-demethylase